MRLYVPCFLFALVAALLVPITVEAQVTDAECLAVYDENGTRIARTTWNELTNGFVFLAHQGRVAMVKIKRRGISGELSLRFTDTGCTGDAYMHPGGDLQPLAHVIGNQVWYPDTQAVEVSVQISSIRESGSDHCDDYAPRYYSLLPAYNFTLPSYTPPFHLEPEPCSPPPDPEQFINGCIKNNGTLKIVDDPADCASNESPITLLGK